MNADAQDISELNRHASESRRQQCKALRRVCKHGEQDTYVTKEWDGGRAVRGREQARVYYTRPRRVGVTRTGKDRRETVKTGVGGLEGWWGFADEV